MKKNLEGLKTSTKVSSKFPIKNLASITAENGTENKTGCYSFIEADGPTVLSILLGKYFDDSDLTHNCLKIISSCLKYLPDNNTALKIATSELPTQCQKIAKEPKSNDQLRDTSIEILARLSDFEIAIPYLFNQNLGEFSNQKFKDFLLIEQLNASKIKELTQLFNLTKNLISNSKFSQQKESKEIISNFLNLYQKNKDLNFLSDPFIRCVYDISKNFEGVQAIRQSSFSLEETIISAIRSRNPKLILLTEKMVINLMTSETLSTNIEKLKKENSKSQLLYVSFLAQNELYVDLLRDYNLLEITLQFLKNSNKESEIIFGVFRLLSGIVKVGGKFIDKLFTKETSDEIINCISNITDLLVLTEINIFLSLSINKSDDRFFEDIENNISNKIISYFSGQSKMFEDFFSLALTPEKAFDSIEYHKSEITKAILENLKQINKSELVEAKIATNYLLSENYLNSVFNFLLSLSKRKELQISHQFLITSNSAIKVFKNSKSVHESLFQCLSKTKLTKENGDTITIELNWPFQLSNIIWRKTNWKRFAYFVLQFLDSLMKDERNVTTLKQGINTIKLVASINHFITEEDNKDLEGAVEIDEEEDEALDILTFTEERGIQTTSAILMDKLIDTSVLATIKNNINKKIHDFKPQMEAVQIFRAELAIIAVVNGLKYFGSEGLRSKDHNWLLTNINEIEKCNNQKYFTDKEKLIADSIRSIANFICITNTQQGKDIYEENEVSAIVFNLLNSNLSQSKTPLNSYVILKTFKQWLINRIQIIENDPALHNPNSFMLVLNSKKDKTVSESMDALYVTFQRFPDLEKLLKLTMEVVILLGYVYPEWKNRTAKTFLPSILTALSKEKFSQNCDHKAVELLKLFAGCDEKSEGPNKEIVEAIGSQKGLRTLCRSIGHNNYNEKYIAHCLPLLDALGQDPESIEVCSYEIDKLLKILKEFNQLPNEKKIHEIDKAIGVAEQINAFCLVEPLRMAAYQKGHIDVVKDLWSFINQIEVKDPNDLQKFSDLEKTCPTSISLHLKELEKQPENKKKIYGDDLNNKNSILLNALKSLQKNKKDQVLVGLNSKIVNNAFPQYSKLAKELAKSINFEPDLQFIFETYKTNEDIIISTETKNLYINLSNNEEEEKEKMMERMLQQILRKLDEDIANKEPEQASKDLNDLIPFIDNILFITGPEDYDIVSRINKILKMLNDMLQQKTGKNVETAALATLGSPKVPDISFTDKNLLKGEIELSSGLLNFIQKSPKKLKDKIFKEMKNENTPILMLLNGKPENFQFFQEICEIENNRNSLKSKSFQNALIYLYLKNNKDSFKFKDFVEESLNPESNQGLAIPMNVSVFETKMQTTENQKPNEMMQSALFRMKADQNKIDSFDKNLINYKILTDLTKIENKDYIDVFINESKNYQPNLTEKAGSYISACRLLFAAMKTGISPQVISNKQDDLQDAYRQFLLRSEGDKSLPEKAMRLLEKIIYKANKLIKQDGKKIKSKEFFNSILNRYFVVFPALMRKPKKVLKLLKLLSPSKNIREPKRKFIFNEHTGNYKLILQMTDEGILSSENIKGIQTIFETFSKLIESNRIDSSYIVPVFETVSNSKIFSQLVLNSKLIEKIIGSFAYYEKLDISSTFNSFSRTLIHLVSALDTEEKIKTFNSKVHSDNLIDNFIEIFQKDFDNSIDCSIEALIILFDIIESKQTFFQKDAPSVIFKYYSSCKDQQKKTEILLLLGKLAEEFSLQKTLIDKQLFNTEIEFFKNFAITPDLLKMSLNNELSQDKNLRRFECCSYILGELSKSEQPSQFLADSKQATNIFFLYDKFEILDINSILATKIIQSTRNGVYKFSDASVIESEKLVRNLLEKIPLKIQKLEKLTFTVKMLKEILEYFKIKIDKLDQQKVPDKVEPPRPEPPNTAPLLLVKYKMVCVQTESGPLNQDLDKLLGKLNSDASDLVQNQNELYTLSNIDVPKYLRTIANSNNINSNHRGDVLKLLNNFADNAETKKKLISTPFYVEKSIDNIITLIDKKDLKNISNSEKKILIEDLTFLDKLTQDQKGKKQALEKPQIIDQLCKIINSDTDEAIKLKATDVLNNIFGQIEPNQQNQILKDLQNNINKALNSPDLLSALIRLIGNYSRISDQNKQNVLDLNLLQFISKALHTFPTHQKILTNSSYAIYHTGNQFPKAHKQIIDSNAFVYISKAFIQTNSPKELHESCGKSVLQVGYGNNDNKLSLHRQGLGNGLPVLLKYYSQINLNDQQTCSILLKCMGNFSLIGPGTDTLLSEQVIPTFRTYFSNYKETMNEQNKILIGVISNMSSEANTVFIDRIVTEQGHLLILEALQIYKEKKNDENLEVTLDALTHLSVNKNVADYISKSEDLTRLIDIIRERMAPTLVYKTIRCFVRLAENQTISNLLLSKGGVTAVLDLLSANRSNLQLIAQILKLIFILTKKLPERLEEITMGGCPSKFISIFDENWPVHTAEIISNEKGNKLIDNVLAQHISSEGVPFNVLLVMENLLRLRTDAKPEYLSMQTDVKVEKIFGNAVAMNNKDLGTQSTVVLELLRLKDKTENEEQHVQVVQSKLHQQPNLNEIDVKNSLVMQEFTQNIPIQIQKFLKKGQILTVFREDRKERSMHFFVSDNFSELRCKRPRENFIKSKWIIPVHQIRIIRRGFDKLSPIPKSGGIFKKIPPPDRCFAVFGPSSHEEPVNFHFVCEEESQADQWYTALAQLLNEYKKNVQIYASQKRLSIVPKQQIIN